mmetsp:Transcript_40869/g.94736  ORF Transcript_40869/g.94736 Transcript_40869/m.94736 type:complete len:127 (-) Transcript_40869:13-393(-)
MPATGNGCHGLNSAKSTTSMSTEQRGAKTSAFPAADHAPIACRERRMRIPPRRLRMCRSAAPTSAASAPTPLAGSELPGPSGLGTEAPEGGYACACACAGGVRERAGLGRAPAVADVGLCALPEAC